MPTGHTKNTTDPESLLLSYLHSKRHVVFGQVVEGMDVLDKMEAVVSELMNTQRADISLIDVRLFIPLRRATPAELRSNPWSLRTAARSRLRINSLSL